MNSHTIVELAPFRLAEGVSEDELLQASEALQSEFLSKQKGFIRRELLRKDDGEWCDLVYWENAAAAQQVVAAVANSWVCQRYFQLMIGADPNDPAAGVEHLAVVRTYDG